MRGLAFYWDFCECLCVQYSVEVRSNILEVGSGCTEYGTVVAGVTQSGAHNCGTDRNYRLDGANRYSHRAANWFSTTK